MITLQRLVTTASSHYGLKLTNRQQEEVVGKLRIAGYGDDLPKRKVSEVVDVIFSLVRVQPSNRALKIRQAYHTAGGPKLIGASAVHQATCPRCKGPMHGARLATSELVDYCRKCKIALPLK